MSIVKWFLIFGALCVIRIDFLNASYRCGIRKHSFIQLVHRGWTVEEGQWPWHVAMFHKMGSGSPEYACGGTLLDQKHILTAAHCVVDQDTQYPFPPAKIELHFGQQNLSKKSDRMQIRDVSKVHIHPEFSTHRNDIAVVVTRLPVEFTDFVIPICMDQRADRDLRNLEGQRGWITGWGTTENDTISDVLRTASMPVVSYLQCFNDDQTLFGNILNPNVFCAGDRNGTSPGTGDSGGGMYFSEGDRWVLRGIVSFAKADELKAEVDTSQYAVFVNVQRFLTWVKEVMDESKPEAKRRLKRISETECERFMSLARKRANGLCNNSRYQHAVSLIYKNLGFKSNGVLVNENHVISACRFFNGRGFEWPVKVQIEGYGEVDVANTICHPQYHPRYVYHDLAVVKLSTSITLTSSLIPACLASDWSENLYDTLLHTGYGTSKSTGVKKFIETDENQVITNEECDSRYRAMTIPNGTTSGMLCVINSDQLRLSNSGSSGSPLQSVNSRTCMYTVVGVTCFVDYFSEKDRDEKSTVLDVYTRVAHYLDWIEQIVWNVEPSTTTTASSATTTASSTQEEVTSSATVKMPTNVDFVFPDN